MGHLCTCDICFISLCLDDISMIWDMELSGREQTAFRNDLVEMRAGDMIEMEVEGLPGR